MTQSFEEKILPKLINAANARARIEALLIENVYFIGEEKLSEFQAIESDAAFFTETIRYAILSDHKERNSASPQLSDLCLSNRVPTTADLFFGRDKEFKSCVKQLKEHSPLFIQGVAGIGKSEFAKHFAEHNAKKYQNVLYFFYYGSLKQCIAEMDFKDDPPKMSEEARFERHYHFLKQCRSETLVILDNFDVLPQEDDFFKEFSSNAYDLLVTTRCRLPGRNMLELSTLDPEQELFTLFHKLCPSVTQADSEIVREIIRTVHFHTLTVTLAALTLSVAGMDAADLLHDLRECGIAPANSEIVELYKDNDYTDGLMQEHLGKLLRLKNLTEQQRDLLSNLSLIPEGGIDKQHFKEWLRLPNLSDMICLIRHGLVQDDAENRLFSLHPVIRDIVFTELKPSVTGCQALLESLSSVCSKDGKEPRQAGNVRSCLISVANRILVDDKVTYLHFLQTLYPYLEKYRPLSDLESFADRMEEIISAESSFDPYDHALSLLFQADSAFNQGDLVLSDQIYQQALSVINSIPKERLDRSGYDLMSNIYASYSIPLYLSGKKKEAYDAVKIALSIRNSHSDLGLRDTHDYFRQLHGYAQFLIGDGLTDEVIPIIQQCLNHFEASFGKESFDYAYNLLLLGSVKKRQGKQDEAASILRTARGLFRKVLGEDSDYVARIDEELS